MQLRRSDLGELHCIVPIANVPSIVRLGILSHERARTLDHISIASNEVQAIRAGKVVPNGRRLHHYANLYVDARNPMTYVLKDGHLDLCVLRVSTDVLDLPEVVIADGNAAGGMTRFSPSPGGCLPSTGIWCLPSGGTTHSKRSGFGAPRFSSRR